MADSFETVHRTSDRLEAEMVAEVLVQEGIDARLIGTTNAALIGVAPHVLRLRIEVPSDDAAEARELVAGLLAADAADAAAAAEAEAEAAATEAEAAAAAPVAPAVSAAAAGSDGEAESAATTPRRRSPILAGGAAFVLPGGGHIYARHPWSGLILAAGYVLTLIVMVAGARRHAVVAACAFTFGALLLADLVAGQLAVRRANAGLLPTRPRQLLRGVVLVCLAAGFGALVGSRVPPPKPSVDPLIERGLLDLPRRGRTNLGAGAPGAGAPQDLRLVPPELEGLLQLRGPGSQPASAPLRWPRPGIPDPPPPAR
jgi:hypothetical protein